MNPRHLTIGFGLVLLLAGAGTSAEAKTQKLTCTFSGTFVDGVETHIDTNGDGLWTVLWGRLSPEELLCFEGPRPSPLQPPEEASRDGKGESLISPNCPRQLLLSARR